MSTIYLYVKQHKKTGLKYFGQTHTKNPYDYKGSGVYWKKHLSKHGKDIDTLQVWEFQDQLKATEFAIDFSIKNNIVESKEWANLDVEDAKQGAALNNKNAKGNLGKSKTKQHRENISKSKTGIPRPDLIGNNYASALKGRKKTVQHQEAINKKLNSIEVKQKIANAWASKPTVKCPHCAIEGKAGHNMIRYHFDNCKKANNNEYSRDDQ